MKLILLAPERALNWMLVADELVDPNNWSVFLLNHGPETERFRFESAVQQASAENNVVLTAYRLRCKPGLCSLEYSWGVQPLAINAHAQRVAELLSIDVELPDAALNALRTG